MVWPVYRNGAPLGTVEERRASIVGWIFAAFSMEGLLGGGAGERGALALEVFDGSELRAGRRGAARGERHRPGRRRVVAAPLHRGAAGRGQAVTPGS
jgi:hypothetical protein